MKTFDELEKAHRNLTIGLEKEGAMGVLALSGTKTTASLHSQKPLKLKGDDRGWFDLRLDAPEVGDIFLHHALVTNTTTRMGAPTAHETKIYPNVIAFGASAINADGSVAMVAFTLEKLSSFFDYQVFERLSLYKLGDKKLEELRALRKEQGGGDQDDHDFFAPTEVHLTHRVPRFLKFRVGQRIYEVFGAGRSQSGWASVKMESWPRAIIKFDTPVSIDTALDYVWEWRRYFESMAMEAMQPLEISVAGSKKSRAATAELYLPGLEPQPPSSETFGFWKGHIPLRTWKERRALSAAMKAWLDKGEERRAFRAAINKVLRRHRRRVIVQDIVTLCGGIESLEELKVPNNEISSDDVQALTSGAYAVAASAGIKVTEQRLKGLLGMLRMQSLQGKMKLMADAVQSLAPSDDCDVIVKAAMRLRNAAAHGQEVSRMLSPDTAPTIEGLLALCVFFDLLTSGVSAVAKAGRLREAFSEAVRELRQLAAAQA
jgi:hypothetical protein